jgi:hypothetical protein
MLLSILAAATQRDEACALIDGSDAFSPRSGSDSGVELKHLLWVRCHNLDQTLKVTDLVLQGGGFSVVAMDVGDMLPGKLLSVPLTTWFRFQRSIEKTPTILTIISRQGAAKTCASLAVKAGVEDFGIRISEFGSEESSIPSHSRLLTKSEIRSEIVRHRQNPISEIRNPKFPYVRLDLYSSFSRPVDRP